MLNTVVALPTNPANRTIFEDIEAGEELISPNTARTLPPFAIDGKRSDLSTFYRACDRGRIAADGARVKLEFLPAKGGRATTRSSLIRFMRRLACAPAPTIKVSEQHRQAEKALARMGL